jgi:LysR family glycine cleavage system transcriptional activator
MNWIDLPPLNSLRAFLALAENDSYAAAGRALNVSHGAVMQQIRALENRLGVALVERSGRGVILTAEGQTLARELADGFAIIERGVGRMTGDEDRRPVKVSMSPAFATSWLMPRLPDFKRRHPGVTLTLMPTSEVLDLHPGGVEIAVRYSDRRSLPDLAGIDVLLLADMVAVCAPDLVGEREITRPSQLADLPWLEELGTDEASDWMRRKACDAAKPAATSQMPGNLIMEAVRRGDGITYTARPFVEPEIRAGALIEFFPDPQFGVYFLETVPDPNRAPVSKFLRWLRRQARPVKRV